VSTYYLVQGDDAPQIQVTLTRDETGAIIDLTNKTAVFKFRKKGTELVLATLSDIASPSNNEAGIAIFQWGTTDLDISPGLYEGEIEITDDATARKETVYEKFEFQVREDF
jgi:hypothetical protein